MSSHRPSRDGGRHEFPPGQPRLEPGEDQGCNENHGQDNETERGRIEFDSTSQVGVTEDQVQGERGAPAVSRIQSFQARLSSALAAALMLAVGGSMLFWYYTSTLARQTQARQAAQTASASRAQAEMPLPALGRIEAPVVAPAPANVAADDSSWLSAPPLQPATICADEALGGTNPVGEAGVSQPDPVQLALQRRLSGTVFVRDPQLSMSGFAAPGMSGYSRGSAGPPAMDARRTAARELGRGTSGAFADAESGADERSDSEGEFAFSGARATAGAPSMVQASMLPTQRFLLPKGAFIDCTLETAIDSTLPGMTTCITATDTFGADGQVVLLERGTKLIGATQGRVNQGAARVFVLWSEARTPAGVVVPLASPGADELGRAGLPGEVNRHFMDRFGAAILISVIDGAIQSAVQSSNRAGAVVFNPSGSRDVLAEVLRGTVNIRPTVVKRHGDRVQVLVARDLDFRSVYALRSLASVQR